MKFPFQVIVAVFDIIENIVDVVVAAISVGTSHVCFLLLVVLGALRQAVLRQLLKVYAFYRSHCIVIFAFLILCLENLSVAFNVLPFLFKNLGRLRFLLNSFQIDIFISNIVHQVIFKRINRFLVIILIAFLKSDLRIYFIF